MTAILKREVRAYFEMPLGYVFLAVYDLFAGYFFFRYNLYGNSTDMRGVFEMLFTVTIFLIPLLTMRLMSEDRKARTDQLLLMSPVTALDVVMAKFLAACVVYAVAVGITVIMAQSLTRFARPDWPVIAGHIIGLLLLGMALIAVGLLISALTENQIIAAVGGFCTGFFLMLLDSISVSVTNPLLAKLLVTMSFHTHYKNFTLGVCSVTDIVFYFSVTAFFLLLSVCAFERRRVGGKSLYGLLILLSAVIVLLVNVIAGALEDRYRLSYDLTSNQVFELSDGTLDYIKELREPVQIRVLAQEERFADTSAYNAQANEIMKAFARNSEAITIEYVDYVRNPGFAASYPDIAMKHGDVLVESSRGYRLIPTEELFEYGTNAAGKLYIASSRAEQAVGMAVLHVTAADMPKAMILTGHEEEELPGLRELLQYNNYEVIPGRLATEDVDASVDVVIMAAPKSDYSETELEKLETFLENGGEYGKTLFYCADTAQPELPLLTSYLREWGAGIGDGMVFETDQNRVYQYQPFYGIVDYVDTEYASKLKNRGAPVLMPVSRPLTQLFRFQENYRADVLLQFGESSGVRPPDAEDGFQAEDAKIKGPLPALLLCSYQSAKNQASHVLVSGSVRFLDQSVLSTDAFANAAYVMQVMNDLCETDSGFVVENKSLAGTALNITRQKADAMGNFFVFFIPFAVLFAGGGVWLFRRHR